MQGGGGGYVVQLYYNVTKFSPCIARKSTMSKLFDDVQMPECIMMSILSVVSL